MTRSCARLAVCLLALAHLAVALVPCRTDAALSDARGPHAEQPAAASGPSLAAAEPHPCHPGAAADGAAPPTHSERMRERCGCGCSSGGAPPSGSARLGAALLLAQRAPLDAHELFASDTQAPRLPARSPAPLDHVPLRSA